MKSISERCNVLCKFVAAAVCIFAVSVSNARNFYVWNAQGSGGWQSAGQYFLEDGTTPASRAPESNDVVRIPDGVAVEISTDSDAEFVKDFAGVNLNGANSTFILNQPSDVTLGCALYGSGKFVKRTAATVTLAANRQTDLRDKVYTGYSAYYSGGITIEKGILVTPQEAAVYTIAPVMMSNDTTLVVNTYEKTIIEALNGYGVVSNTCTEKSGAQYMQIGFDNWASQTISHFYGRILGNGIKWYAAGTTYLHGTENTFAGNGFVQWGQNNENNPNQGHLWFYSFGKKGFPSSIGASYATLESRIGGSFHYLGGGETTDKNFSWRAQVTPPVIFDAGPTGGVNFTGTWSQYNNTSPEKDHRMGRFVITGSNTLPFVISGQISTPTTFNGTNYTTYITKKGSGTWRFSNNDNEQKGVLAVQDGTLQFTSIAETNVACALGYSSILHEDYYGLRDDSRAVGYAFLLGGSGTFPTFEYMGGKVSICSTRPMELTGGGGRIASSGDRSQLSFAGVSAHEAGEKLLMLGGDSIYPNSISNITPGKGSVAIAKDGPGRWMLCGSNVISGTLDVKAGTLEIIDRYSPKFTWFRLVIKELYNTSVPIFTPEFALYDSEGSNRVAGLKYRFPTNYVDSASAITYVPADVSDLLPGEATPSCATASGTVYIYAHASSGLASLFDGKGGTYWWRMLANPAPNGLASSYVYVVMRLPEDCPEIVRYDICVGTSNANDGRKQTIKRFSVEGSIDGMVWTPLTDDITTDQSNQWLSDVLAENGNAFVDGHPLRPDAGLELAKVTLGDESSAHAIDGVASVRVAPGATLVALGQPKTVSGLTVDCSAGVGTIKGIEFASGGTINLVNVPEGSDPFTVSADLSNLSQESLANINSYSVEVNGRRSGKIVRVSSSSVDVLTRGTAIFLR